MTRRRFFLLLLSGALFSIGGPVLLLLFYANPFRVVDRLQILDTEQLPDGQMLILGQRYNGNIGEPSTISLYQSVTNDTWVSYYVDHEAFYWRNAKLQPRSNTNLIDVFNANELVATVAPETFKITFMHIANYTGKAFYIDSSPLADPDKNPSYIGSTDPLRP